ncbi:2-(1,2-epoxy-1,2-dihydrophenyl)acetyl-CoA isomerase [Pseudonocardia sediminis]|uniref:2-(1,2-epoxy-1,2-dihydrophenyl)acetyl-CoA isomerase n=1 Tax=Pseudonocardia sediminis TaxID=1397368 RepID=A0A4Q7UR14_PSEST|nr:enoyl-CoA hydratase-related protein [Pseudonocardia sediminis]RZT84257.1 2-(1,2-epoxy-1,2-dihydrophenyl)acetyl-CoA isomerase [Pseudonocardia sediminis]
MDGTVTAAPAELARRLYDALAGGDAETLDALVDPAFVGVLADGMPDGAGTHDGAEAMRRDGWGAIGRGFRARAEPERFLELADGRLLVTGRYTGSGRRGGTTLDAAFAHLLTVDGGRITHLEQYTDTARWRDAASPFTTLTLTITDGVADLRLNRPDDGNAIDVAMARDLREAATLIAEDDSVRVVLLRGNGPMLTAGGDIGLMSGTAHAELPTLLRRMIDDYHLALERFAAIDAPLVVGVRGAAAGGGLGLVCTADYAVAATDAVFAVGYGRLGLTADGGNTWYLPRLVGMRRAQEMFLLNRRLTADEALEWGLLNRVVPADDVDTEAEAVARTIAAGPTRAFGGMRRLLRTSYETPLGEQLHAEKTAIVDVAATDDAAEGIAAFAQRRRPGFTGR